jgi:hypothetical protein
MTTADEDIFGQIDALLGKRSPAVLTDRNLQGDDFPTLTEVINTDISDSLSNMPTEHVVSGGTENRQAERRKYERRQVPSSDVGKTVSNVVNDCVLNALESRLLDLLRSQNALLEKSLRLIIQQELERYKSN